MQYAGSKSSMLIPTITYTETKGVGKTLIGEGAQFETTHQVVSNLKFTKT